MTEGFQTVLRIRRRAESSRPLVQILLNNFVAVWQTTVKQDSFSPQSYRSANQDLFYPQSPACVWFWDEFIEKLPKIAGESHRIDLKLREKAIELIYNMC
jgi:hypothetical protein